MVVLSFISWLLVTTLLSNWLPTGNDSNQLLVLEQKVNALAQEVDTKNQYIENLKVILNGDEIGNAQVEDTSRQLPLDVSNIDLSVTHPIDSQFRKEFEDIDLDYLAYKNRTQDALQEIFFFTPVSGVISKGFEIKTAHYGVDLVAKKNEPIKF